MTRQERAKQFMPFDAMKGLNEALRDREERHLRVKKHDVSEEDGAKISAVLNKCEKGFYIKIKCYKAFHDVVIQGEVEKIDKTYRFLRIKGEKIFFDDLYSIEIKDIPKK